MLEGTKVFVTGGSGVIGSELVPLLHEQGLEILVGDLKPKPPGLPAEIIYRQGDLNEMNAEELKSFDPSIIIHLAATFERSRESLGFWTENFRHNIRLSNHIMSLAQSLRNLERVVFASSYLVYDPSQYLFDEPQEVPVRLKEQDRLDPRNLTGMAKLAHEKELRFLSNFADCPFTSVSARIFRGFGKDSRDVISRWVRSGLRNQTISVYQPEGLFDYIYSKDSARGLLELARNRSLTGPINLGSGKAHRVAEIVDLIIEAFPGLEIRSETVTEKFEASEADISQIRQFTQWRPSYDLERAIEEVISHESKRLA